MRYSIRLTGAKLFAEETTYFHSFDGSKLANQLRQNNWLEKKQISLAADMIFMKPQRRLRSLLGLCSFLPFHFFPKNQTACAVFRAGTSRIADESRFLIPPDEAGTEWWEKMPKAKPFRFNAKA